jgi:prepilin-type N-terminal cleavage/methylation domain-containing protein
MYASPRAHSGPKAKDTKPQRCMAQTSSGFTILELLVVLSVIAIICALVLPAVQQGREAARCAQCKNNLRQIGIAIQSYNAATNCSPSGWIIETPVVESSQNGWAWLAMLLPQIEQNALFNGINFNHHVGSISNLTSRLTVVDSFLCPSENVPKRVPFYFAGEASSHLRRVALRMGDDSTGMSPHTIMFEVAGGSYVGVFGPDDPMVDFPDAVGSGIFSANSKACFADVLDGLSQTLFVGERSAQWMASTWTGIHQLEEESFERVVGFTNHVPNDRDADEAEFSSRHCGGVNFLFGDGTVRFLSDHITRAVYQGLGTRNGQESIERTQF